MGYRSSPVPSTFKLCITNPGGAASSFATNGNPEDWKLILERIQGFLDVKYWQKIKNKNCEAKLLGLKAQLATY